MTTEELEEKLKEAQMVRDQWCDEYVRVRDELTEVKAEAEFYKRLSLRW